MDNVWEKYEKLIAYLKGFQSLAVAFSSGVDSTLLLAAAKEALGEKVMAITASSASFPVRELEEANEFCKKLGVKQEVFCSEELDIEGFRENPVNRCYICKKELFGRICSIAEENHMEAVAEGSNLDDNNDYRPGMLAVAELGVLSPLRKVGLNKAEIRELSKRLHLPTWNKQSFACLATRFVYGEPITEEKLHMVDCAEQRLLDLGFHQVRVRIHGDMARIEVLPEEIERLIQQENRTKIYEYMKSLGFSYVSLDLAGYRTGSMNETIVQ